MQFYHQTDISRNPLIDKEDNPTTLMQFMQETTTIVFKAIIFKNTPFSNVFLPQTPNFMSIYGY